MGSSPEVEFADPVTSSVDPTDANSAAASSSSEEKGAEVSLLDSVKEALGDKERSPGSDERDPVDPVVTKTEGVKPEVAAVAEDDLESLTDDELKKYGPKTQRRMRQLLGARAELSTKVADLEPKAARVDQLDQFLKQNRMTEREHAVMLEIGALLTMDPFKAKDRLAPIMAELDRITGNVLPPEVQERVDLGYISREDAQRLVAAEKREALTREQTDAQRREREADDERRSLEQRRDHVKGVGNSWEAAVKAKDPDWSLKQQRFGELVELEVRRNGLPPSDKAMVAMCDTLYANLNKEFSRFAPKPKAIAHVAADASSRANAAPTTALEAAKQALAR